MDFHEPRERSIIFDRHDLFKGHIRLSRSTFDGRELYELHIGSRQIGFYADGEWLYSETNFSMPAPPAGTKRTLAEVTAFGAEDLFVPKLGHDAVCADCAAHGIDGKGPEIAP